MRWILLLAITACTKTEPKPNPAEKPVAVEAPPPPATAPEAPKAEPAPPEKIVGTAAAIPVPDFPDATELPPKIGAKPSTSKIVDTKLPDKERRGHHVGEKVTLSRRVNRAVQPSESKQAKVLDLTAGLHGTIVGFASRQVAGTTLDVALVKWDAQRWNERLAAPIDRVKDGVAYDAAALDAMNDQLGDPMDLPSFTAGLFFEELN